MGGRRAVSPRARTPAEPPPSACGCGASANAAATTARRSTRSSTRRWSRTSGSSTSDGQPFVIPTLHARGGDVVYCHGSTASRTLRALRTGAPACLTVSLIDGLVLARSAMHHSANYRSAMLLGTARAVDAHAEKLAALEAIVEHIVPGRWARRAPADRERAEGDGGARAPDRRGLGEGPQRPAARRRGGLRAAGVGRRDPARAASRARRSPTRGCAPASRCRPTLAAYRRPASP